MQLDTKDPELDLQILGQNTNHHLADGTYIGNMVYIADGSGLDTFSAEAETTAVYINLTPGSWSYVQTAENLKPDAERRLVLNDDGTSVQGQMFIGYGSQIENAVGSSYDDTIIGNNAANYLDGGSGVDTVSGKDGNDTYIVDNTQDQVIEEAGGGTDSIYSSASDYTLPDFVENGICLGSNNINMTGNSQDNILLGNSGNNVLTGNAGANLLSGGDGADIFVFNQLDSDRDTISDFAVGSDKIGFQGSDFSDNLADLISNLSFDATSNLLSYNNQGFVYLENCNTSFDDLINNNSFLLI